jgi:hypothetical protein
MDSQDRRSTDAVMLALVQTIQHDITEMKITLKDHIETEPQEWADLLEDMMGKAFPNGDPEGHREAHEAQMAAVRDRAAFWKTMLIEVSKYGILGVLGWLVFHAWAAFVKGPQ